MKRSSSWKLLCFFSACKQNSTHSDGFCVKTRCVNAHISESLCEIHWVPILYVLSVFIPRQSSPWTAPLAVGWPHSECSDSSLLLTSCASSIPPDRSSRSHTYTTERQREQCSYWNKKCTINNNDQKPLSDNDTQLTERWIPWHTAYGCSPHSSEWATCSWHTVWSWSAATGS